MYYACMYICVRGTHVHCEMCSGSYVGDSSGNIKVLKIEQEVSHIVQMKYTIPFTACRGEMQPCHSLFF